MNPRTQLLAVACYGILGGMMAVFCIAIIGNAGGCKNLDSASRPQDDTAYAERSIGKIVGRADEIEDNADVIQKRTPRASLLRIIENVQAIKFNAGAIREDVADGLHALGEANKKIEGLQASNATLTKERDEARKERDSSLRKATYGSVGLSIFGLAVAAAIFAHGESKIAKVVAAFSGTLLIAAVLVGWYSTWLALAVAVPLAIGLSVAVFLFVRNLRKKLDTEYKATDVMAERLNAAKQIMEPEKRAQLFGVGAYPGDIETAGLDKGAADPAVRATIKESVDAAKKATPLAVATPVVVTNVATKTTATATRKRKGK